MVSTDAFNGIYGIETLTLVHKNLPTLYRKGLCTQTQQLRKETSSVRERHEGKNFA